ncbi:MAG: hypothetical protein AAF672_05325 [Pseudomonadota bacterium]
MESASLIEALRRLRHYEALPEKDRNRAAKLLSRLETPVRVTLLGPQQGHIHALIGQLLGETLPPLPPAPVTFGYGGTERILAIRPCGTVEDVSVHQGPTAALFFESPVAFLSTVQLTAFPWRITRDAPPNFEEIDIAIWCTDSFSEDELSVWDTAPNILKDHSFLLATEPSDPEIAEVEFLSFYQAATPEDAVNTYASVARDLKGRVESGRAADLDNAALFVEMHREALEGAPEITEHSATSVNKMPPSDQERAVDVATPNLDAALSLLRQDASYMLSALDDGAADACDAVLGQCAETGQSLSTLFENDQWARSEPALHEEVAACADRLLLLSMESGAEPAIEAVTTLVQLKQDFELRQAA